MTSVPSRAPSWIAAAFAVALALLITLVGPLLLFSPPFVSTLQERHAVAATFGVERAEVDRVTVEILVDLFVDGDFDSAFAGEPPLLDARERAHMHDVAQLVRLLLLVVIVAAVVAVLAGWRVRHEPVRRGRLMMLAAGSIGAAAAVLAVIFAVAFEPAFLAFHAVFFPPDSFLFAPGSNLITLFPEPFWFEASLAAGASIIGSALIVGALGWWTVRKHSTPSRTA
jgi:integral membrane protein (TIGR01906 family)